MDPIRHQLKQRIRVPDNSGEEDDFDAYTELCAAFEGGSAWFFDKDWTYEGQARVGTYTGAVHVAWISINLGPEDDEEEEHLTQVIITDHVGSCCACSDVMMGAAPPDEGVSELERYMQQISYLVDRATVTDDHTAARTAFIEAVTKAAYYSY